MTRRLVVLAAVAFALLYIILRPIARLLLFTLRVSPALYNSVVPPLTVAVLIGASALVAVWTGLSGRRLILPILVGVATPLVLILGVSFAAVALLPGSVVLAVFASEPSSVLQMALSCAATVVAARAMSLRLRGSEVTHRTSAST